MSDINLMELTKKAERDLADIFADIDNTAFLNTERVIDSFRTHRVDDTCFAGTSGYGHDDRGRDTKAQAPAPKSYQRQKAERRSASPVRVSSNDDDKSSLSFRE